MKTEAEIQSLLAECKVVGVSYNDFALYRDNLRYNHTNEWLVSCYATVTIEYKGSRYEYYELIDDESDQFDNGGYDLAEALGIEDDDDDGNLPCWCRAQIDAEQTDRATTDYLRTLVADYLHSKMDGWIVVDEDDNVDPSGYESAEHFGIRRNDFDAWMFLRRDIDDWNVYIDGDEVVAMSDGKMIRVPCKELAPEED